MQYTSHSVTDTQLFAKEQALELTRRAEGQGEGSREAGIASEPLVIALEGELGAGKTTFTQAFSEALGVKEKVKSPTFVLMKQYELTGVPGYQKLCHLDCYRLNGSGELHTLGVEEILKTHGTIVLIEWAERVADILPPKHWTIHIDHISENTRNINVYQK